MAIYKGYESAVDWPTARFFRELSLANLGQWPFAPIDGVVLELKFTDRFPSWMHKLAQVFDLQDERFETYQVEMWLEKGAYPWVGFHNGAGKPAAYSVNVASSAASASLSSRSARANGLKEGHVSIPCHIAARLPPAIRASSTTQTCCTRCFFHRGRCCAADSRAAS